MSSSPTVDSKRNTPPPSATGGVGPTSSGGFTGGIADAASTIASWAPVQTARKSAVWSFLKWPFSAFSRLCSRVFYAIRGYPVVVDRTVTVDVPGTVYGSSLTKMAVERAIRRGYMTYEHALTKFGVDENVAKLEGWFVITIDMKPHFWSSPVPTKTTIMYAIKHGYISVDAAIKAGHLTAKQANAATWIVKQTVPAATKK